MKYLMVLTLAALILNAGCEKDAPVDVSKEHELVMRPASPMAKGGEEPEVHVRYTLTARHGGKLLVRVREPLLVTEPPLVGQIPGFISAYEAPWADAAGSLSSRMGSRSGVLDLSEEDLAGPLALELRVVHTDPPEEMVGVHLYLYRGDEEEAWINFYQCRPATRTTRASNTVLDRDAVFEFRCDEIAVLVRFRRRYDRRRSCP